MLHSGFLRSSFLPLSFALRLDAKDKGRSEHGKLEQAEDYGNPSHRFFLTFGNSQAYFEGETGAQVWCRWLLRNCQASFGNAVDVHRYAFNVRQFKALYLINDATYSP